MSTTSPGGYRSHLPNITGDDPADGETVQWDATAKAWKSVAPSGGGGGSATPGQAAHYIGTWDVAVAYATGECVRQWDGSEFKLYQAKKATTGDDPTSVVASWAEVTTPIVMWGSENPLFSDPANVNGYGIPGPLGTVYHDINFGNPWWNNGGVAGSWRGGSKVAAPGDPSAPNVTVNADTNLSIEGATLGNLSGRVQAAANNDGNANVDISRIAVADNAGGSVYAGTYPERDSGSGNVVGETLATIYGDGVGDTDVRSTAQVNDTVTGTAYAGDRAVHHASGEAHVLPTANAARAWVDGKGDYEFTDNTEGPVIHDQSDGHTYRIVSTAGVLSTVQVT